MKHGMGNGNVAPAAVQLLNIVCKLNICSAECMCVCVCVCV